MNKDWDKVVVSVDIWKECLRVLKPGAFAFIMSAPRQDVLSRMVCNLQDTGFETGFSSIFWTYASGFPKAANVSKLADKRMRGDIASRTKARSEGQNIALPTLGRATKYIEINETKSATSQAKSLDGSYAGFQPKPALEICLVCMKPLSEKSYVDQALANKKGITWLDDCRIPYQNEDDNMWKYDENNISGFSTDKFLGSNSKGAPTNPASKNISIECNQKGRFPANLLVSDSILGSDYSRFFNLDKWFDTTFPFLITPKASKSERNMGLITSYMEHQITTDYRFKRQIKGGLDTPRTQYDSNEQTKKPINSHPTVKPLKLMAYLIMLGSREGDIILDPFCGSGTTLIAANMTNRIGIGIEINQEYCEIAHARSIAQLNKVVI